MVQRELDIENWSSNLDDLLIEAVTPRDEGVFGGLKFKESKLKEKMQQQPNNPLHGITLERMLNELVEELGWEHMGYLVPINCFLKDPSIKSSLKFLRRTPWARTKVEQMYIERIVQFRS